MHSAGRRARGTADAASASLFSALVSTDAPIAAPLTLSPVRVAPEPRAVAGTS